MELNPDGGNQMIVRHSLQSTNNKKFLIVKLPANVKNCKKAVTLLGGKDKIYNRYIKDEDLELNLFSKKIPLEKCLSNDFLIKRKRMRNKNKPGEYKYKFELVGRIDSMYDYMALHDFICIKHDKDKTKINSLEKLFISPETFEDTDGESDLKRVRQAIETNIANEGLGNLKNEYTLLQPEKFSFGRNNYVHILKELSSQIKLDN